MKIAVVTGASSGMGKVFAEYLPKCCKNLDEIWVLARRKEKLQELAWNLAEQFGVYVRIFQADLSEKNWDIEFGEALHEHEPDIRVLVNSAGYGKVGMTLDAKKESLLGMIDVNCRALTKMTLSCIPYMKPGARIISVASAAAFAPQPGFNVYAATKAYVLSFSRALREELRKKKISVTAVCPGPVDTEFFEVSGTTDSLAKKSVMVSADAVVKQALFDAWRRKEVSVYGIWMKLSRIGAKLIPHKWIIKMMNLL